MTRKDNRAGVSRSPSPVRVLHLIVTLTVGGAEDHILSLVRNLERERFNPTVCCIGESGPIGIEIRNAGVPVFALGRLEKGGFDRKIIPQLTGLMRREKIGLVHSHMYHANFYGRLSAFRAGIPIVCSVHNTYTRPKFHRRIANWWLGKNTPRILAGSEAIRNDIVNYDRVIPQKVLVIPYGVDTEKFDVPLGREEARRKLGLPEGGFIVGTVGRLEEQKAQIYLVEAVGMLRRQGEQVTLLLVGSGREEERLREKVRREGLSDNVIFLGTRRDLPDLFRAMDVFSLSSLWEGFPIALLSAMAAGLPVVVTQVGGIPEIVRDGENGLLVPPGDAKKLAAALNRFREDPVTASSCGKSAAETIRKGYSHRRTTQKVMEVYEEVLRG